MNKTMVIGLKKGISVKQNHYLFESVEILLSCFTYYSNNNNDKIDKTILSSSASKYSKIENILQNQSTFLSLINCAQDFPFK